MKPAENYYCTFLNWKCKTDRIGLLKNYLYSCKLAFPLFCVYHNINSCFMPFLGKFFYGHENSGKISTSRWKKWVLRWVHIGLKKGKNIVINLCGCGCTIKFFSRSKRFNLFLFFKKYIHPPKISFIFDFEITLCECWSEVKKGEIKNFGNFIPKVHQSNQKLEAKRVARFAFMLKSEKSAI